MNCERVRDELKAYIDGELGLIQQIRVGRHLAACAECRKEMETMSELTESVQSTPGAPVPEGLRDRVMGKIEFEPNVPRRRFRFSVPAVAAAAALAVVVVTVFVPVFQSTKMRSEGFQNRMKLGRRVAVGVQAKAAAPAPRKGSPFAHVRSDEWAYDTANKRGYGYTARERALASAPLMIIKTADISIRVKRFQNAYDSAVLIAKSTGGYVTNSASATEGDSPTSGSLTVRVPVTAFERSLGRLGKLGKVLSKSISGEDVTGEAVDLESRLRNKRAEERQYLDIMNRARKVQDIVTVSNELYRVRGEIEQAQGRLKYLKSAAAMATIQVSLSEKEKPKPPVKKSSLMNTLDSAVGSLGDTLRSLAAMLIWLAVYSPFWALPLAAYIWSRKKAAAAQRV